MISYFRFLWRNRLYSTINLIGLTVALALSIIIFGYAAAQMKIARSVPGGENIYAVCLDNEDSPHHGTARLQCTETGRITRS